MPKLMLFGQSLSFQMPGTTTFKNLGGMSNQVVVEALNGGTDWFVTFAIDGDFPCATFAGLRDLRLRGLAKDPFVPVAYAGSPNWSVAVKIHKHASPNSYVARLDPGRLRFDGFYGFVFDDNDAETEVLRILQTVQTGDLFSLNGPIKWGVGLNVATGTLDQVPRTVAQFTLAGARPQRFALTQFARRRTSGGPVRSTVDIRLRPEAGYALIHSEFLAADSWDATHIFHYAAANGQVQLKQTRDPAGAVTLENTAAWAGPDAVLLPLRLTDESGLPLALKAGTAGFSLAPIAQHSQTNATTLALAPAIGQKVRIHAVDALNLPPIGAQPAKTPYWLLKGSVPLRTGSPYEINGLARGLRLARVKRDPGDTQDGWPALLDIKEWREAGAQRAGHTTASLRVTEAKSAWQLRVQVPERSVSALAATSSAVLERLSASKADEVSLPLQDFAWTVANTSQTQRPFSEFLWDDARTSDRQFRSAFDALALPDTNFAQMSGARADLLSENGLDKVLSVAVDRAATASDTALPAPNLVAKPSGGRADPSIRYAFGASPAQTGVSIHALAAAKTDPAQLRDHLDTPDVKQVGQFYDAFVQTWLKPADPSLIPHLKTIRDRLKVYRIDNLARLATELSNGLPLSEEVTDLAVSLALELVTALETQAFDAFFLPDATSKEPNPTLEWLRNVALTLTPEEFVQGLAGAVNDVGNDPWTVCLRWCLSPPTYELYRRVVTLVQTANEPGLAAARAALEHALQLGGVALKVDDVMRGFLAELSEGVSTLYSLLERLWAASSRLDLTAVIKTVIPQPAASLVDFIDGELGRLRLAFGPSFTKDVYERILADPSASAALTTILRDQLGQVFSHLKDIVSEPPEYFVLGRRFRSTGRPEQALDLWNTNFDLCRQGGTPWSFFLDEEAAVIVKLGTRRSLRDIIAEIQQGSASGDNPNPLRLPNADDEAYVKDIEGDILDSEWHGIFIVRPTANISEDTTVSAVTGLKHIEAQYVAIGGAKPKWSDVNPPALDVIARIFKDGRPAPSDQNLARDIDLTLVKFDVTVRNTQIDHGEIATQVDFNELFGTKLTGESIILSAVLPPAKPGESSRSFAFQAVFKQPKEVSIKTFCVKSLMFRALRVAKRKDDTVVDCDCDIVFQKPSGLGLQIDFDIDETPLKLDNLLIRLPPIPGFDALKLGERRALNFDFPSASIALGKARSFNFALLSIIPRGLGVLRITKENQKEITENFLNGAMFIDGFHANSPAFDVDCTVPFLNLKLELGSLPGLGGGGSLELDMVTGVSFPGRVPFTFLRGGGASNIELDLFRVLRLHIGKLQFGSGKDRQGKKVSYLHTQDVRLKLLDWEPFSALHFAYVNGARGNDGLGWAVHIENEGSSGAFQFYGMAIARSLQFEQSFYDELLKDPKTASSPMKSLVDPSGDLAATLVTDPNWLFAVAFGIPNILDKCSLVLQDGKYYGIRIGADWLRPLIGADALSLAYIPGETKAQDKFRTTFALSGINLFAPMSFGEMALEWGVNRDFLVDLGFPWVTNGVHNWFRSFSVPIGAYEAKFGFYFQRRTLGVSASKIQFAAGFGLYIGYTFQAGNSVAWVRAGIGVYGILEGSLTFDRNVSVATLDGLRNSVEEVSIHGTVGIYAYGEGGIDVWILSARFRVAVDAYVVCSVTMIRHQPALLTYSATLAAAYSASVEVGCGWFSWTFSVSGHVEMSVSGSMMLG